jgi:predicted RNase H-like HicB family nuclease
MKVKDVIRLLEQDGWFLVATRGSHLEAVRFEGPTLMRYAVVIEKADGNYSAYVPDLPGCVATGDTVAAVEGEIREAIRFHIEGLQADGIAVPQPTSMAEYIET